MKKKEQTIYTKEYIQDKIQTDIRWLERTLLVIYDRQTKDEQNSRDTQENNGVGFTGFDGRYLSWCSEWLKKGNHLSGDHVDKCKKKLIKYWKQVQKIILENEKKKQG